MNIINTIILLVILLSSAAAKESIHPLLKHSPSINYTFYLETKYPERRVVQVYVYMQEKTKDIAKRLQDYAGFIKELKNLTSKYPLDYYSQQSNSFIPLQIRESSSITNMSEYSINIEIIDITSYEISQQLIIHLRQPLLYLQFIKDLQAIQKKYPFQITSAQTFDLIDKTKVSDQQIKNFIVRQSEKRCQHYFNMQLKQLVSYQNIEKATTIQDQSQKQMQRLLINERKNSTQQLMEQSEKYAYYEALQEIDNQQLEELFEKHENDIYKVNILCKNSNYQARKKSDSINQKINKMRTNKQHTKQVQKNIQGDASLQQQEMKEMVVNRSELFKIKQGKDKKKVFDLKKINQQIKIKQQNMTQIQQQSIKKIQSIKQQNRKVKKGQKRSNQL